MSVKSLKKSKSSSETALITADAGTKPVSFIQFAPSAPAAPSASMRGVSITFPDGVNLSLQECSAESVADLLAIYRSRCGAAGGV